MRPIKFLSAAASDFLARTIGQKLTEVYNHQIVIDNRPGAGGLVHFYTFPLSDVPTTAESGRNRHRSSKPPVLKLVEVIRANLRRSRD